MKTIAKNKKAYHDYEILEEIEVGISLLGHEVKSLRKGKCNLKGSFCKVMKGEMWIFDTHISKYEYIDKFTNQDETRTRKLLLKRREIDKWFGRMAKEQHLTIVPLSIYFNADNRVKLTIALVRGKKLFDKRQDQKEKDIKRSMEQSSVY